MIPTEKFSIILDLAVCPFECDADQFYHALSGPEHRPAVEGCSI